MLKLSRSVGYAIQATLILAEQPTTDPVPCSRLAARGHMPERFLLQVLRGLVNHGILHSARGVDGGYSLAKPAGQITLLALIEAVDGPFNPAPTSPHKLPAPVAERLHAAIDRVVDRVKHDLGRVSVADLMDSGGGRR